MAETPIHEKRFSLHREIGAYHPDPQAVESIWRASREIPSCVEGTPGQMVPKMPVASPYNRVAAKWNNPIAFYFVIDTLVKAQRGSYIRPSYVADELNRSVPQFYWKPISIGRILAAVRSVCVSRYNPSALDDKKPDYPVPFDRGRDARGAFYVVDPMGGYEGALWLIKVREWAAEEAKKVMHFEAQGIFTESIWGAEQGFTQPFDYFFARLPDTVREPEYYLASCDDHLWGAARETEKRPIKAVFSA